MSDLKRIDDKKGNGDPNGSANKRNGIHKIINKSISGVPKHVAPTEYLHAIYCWIAH